MCARDNCPRDAAMLTRNKQVATRTDQIRESTNNANKHIVLLRMDERSPTGMPCFRNRVIRFGGTSCDLAIAWRQRAIEKHLPTRRSLTKVSVPPLSLALRRRSKLCPAFIENNWLLQPHRHRHGNTDPPSRARRAETFTGAYNIPKNARHSNRTHPTLRVQRPSSILPTRINAKQTVEHLAMRDAWKKTKSRTHSGPSVITIAVARRIEQRPTDRDRRKLHHRRII